VIAPRPIEETNVLVGVVKEDDGVYQAYIEDVGQRALHKLTADQKIANGKITDVSMASIVYTVEGKPPVTVAVGANLTGAQSGASLLLRQSLASAGRTAFDGNNQGQNNQQLTRGGGGRNGQGGLAGVAAQYLQGQGGGFTTAAGGAANRGRGGPGGQPFVQNAAPVPAPQPLPGTDNMSIEERMRLRRTTEGQPGAAVQMTGTQPTVAAPVAEPTPAPAAPILDPSIGAGLSVEEQMRVRRQQQVGGQ